MAESQSLYKYGAINKYSKALFSTSKVYLCAAEKLNDPFECRPTLSSEGNEDQVVSSLIRGAMSSNPLMTEKKATEHATKLYQDRRHLNAALWEKFQAAFLEMSTKGVGIYCLSAIPNSILMWSHYARGHTGYCIEFEATDRTEFFGEAQPVGYSKEYPRIEGFRASPHEKMKLAFLTKFSDWEYEQEWRIMNNIHGPRHYPYPPQLMKRVIFGMDMSEKHKAKIKKWVRRRGYEIRFAQAMRNKIKFAIDIQPVSD